MRFSDLSEADQRAVKAALGRGGDAKIRRTAKPSTAGSTGPSPIVCHACGERFDRWGVALERHRDSEKHHRFDLILTGPSQGLPQGGNLRTPTDSQGATP